MKTAIGLLIMFGGVLLGFYVFLIISSRGIADLFNGTINLSVITTAGLKVFLAIVVAMVIALVMGAVGYVFVVRENIRKKIRKGIH